MRLPHRHGAQHRKAVLLIDAGVVWRESALVAASAAARDVRTGSQHVGAERRIAEAAPIRLPLDVLF